MVASEARQGPCNKVCEGNHIHVVQGLLRALRMAQEDLMDTKGRIKDISISFPDRTAVLTVEVEAKPEEAGNYLGIDLDIRIVKHRKKRSLTANAYYWELVGKLCTVLRIGKTEMHNRLLAEYGQTSVLPDGVAEWSIKPPGFDWLSSEDVHYRPARYEVNIKGTKYPVFWVIKGSSKYDKSEMAELIDGTVDECKRLGIETRPAWEVAEMWERWYE